MESQLDDQGANATRRRGPGNGTTALAWLGRALSVVALAAVLVASRSTTAGSMSTTEAPNARANAPASPVVSLAPAADTYANEDFPNTPYGSATSLVVARTTEFLTLRRALLRFDVDSLPEGASVISATLRLYHTAGTGPPVIVGARPISATWTSAALTWNNQPDAGAVAATTVLTDRTGWRRWSVTSLVQSWVDGSAANNGVTLRGPEASDVAWSHSLDSLEGPHAPVLDVEYDVAPTATATATATAALCQDANEPNDTRPQASMLMPGEEAGGCVPTPSDLDYFVFSTAAAQHVTLELYDLPADLDLYLQAADGHELASSTSAGLTSERVDYTTSAAGPLYVLVRSGGGWSATAGYHLKLTLGPAVVTPTPTASPTTGATGPRPPRTATSTATPTATTTASPTSAGATGPPPPRTATPTRTAEPTVDWATVGGRVWDDEDRDGRQDRFESGIDRVELNLTLAGRAAGRALTDDEGYYTFAAVAGGGIYRVDVDDGTVPQPLTLTTCCDPVIVVPHDGQDLRGADFGYGMPATATASPTHAAHPSNVDLAPVGIEVTQDTQCFQEAADLDGCDGGDNSIPLVAGKTTVARVFVALNRVNGEAATAGRIWSVDVSLIGWRAATGEMLPGGPLEASIDFVNLEVPLANVRDAARRSANFVLPDDWTAEDLAGIDLMAVVDHAPAECDACDDNNDSTERGLVFRAQPAMEIYPVRVRYTRGRNDVVSSDDAAVTLFSRLTKLYPLDEENVIVHLDEDRIHRTDVDLGSDDGISELLDELADRYVCYEDDFWACGWHEGHYFGVISTTVQLGEVVDGDPLGRWGGMGRVNDCVAVGREGSQGTAAHELGHNLGRHHASNDHGEAEGGDWEEWPYPHGGIGVTGFDTWALRARAIARPEALHWHDLMSYGSGQGKWISPHTYLALHDNLDFCSAASPSVPRVVAAESGPGGPPAPDQAPTPRAYILVTGQLEPPGFRSVIHVTARGGGAPPPDSSAYVLELQDGAGTTLYRRPFEPVHEHVAAGTAHNRFRQYLPDTPGAVRVVLLEDDTPVASRTASASAPTVHVTEPTAATLWRAAGLGTIRWTADDPDGDPLTFIVAYSRDAGATWVNLAAGLTANAYDVELDTLGGGPAVIRVIASDGFRTGRADSAAFRVATKPPQVRIVLPAPEDFPIPEGPPVQFLATGYDREDGLLSGRTLSWLDSGDRLLGTGRSLRLTDLAAGRYSIRVQTTDLDGNTAEQVRTYYVGHLAWLPAAQTK